MIKELKQLAKEKIIIVAHRGVWGGNIPCNTITAYETAVRQGADMIEVDAAKSTDGILLVFHPSMEEPQLNFTGNILEMPYEEIKKLRYINTDDVSTQFGIELFEDVLERFKNRCFLNIDKFCMHPVEIAKAIRLHKMEDQVLVKAAPDKEVLDIIEEYCPDIQCLAIVQRLEDIALIRERKINYIGNEVLFTSPESEFASRDFIQQQHDDGYLVWCNSIVFDYKKVLSGGHNDDTSLTHDPEKGWGWIADQGYDFMQTDWTLMAIDYLRRTGRLYRSSKQ